MKTLPVALQIYTVRDYAAKDFRGTMQAVKDMGYDYVEMGELFGMCSCEVKAILDEIGLEAVSVHAPLAELAADMETAIDKYKVLGCKYIAIPYLGEGSRPGDDGFAQVLADIKAVGALCHSKGMTLLYHNHDFEFVKLASGEYAFDYMYSNVDSDYLQTEIDTCWVKVGGECPSGYIRKYSGRCPVVHLKDFAGKKSEDFAFRPIGYGVQDIPAILEASVESGALYIVVEQDSSDDCTSLEAAEMSRKYLKTLGW